MHAGCSPDWRWQQLASGAAGDQAPQHPRQAAPAQLHFDLTEWLLHLTDPTCTHTFTSSLFALTDWFDCFSKLDACTRRQGASAALQ